MINSFRGQHRFLSNFWTSHFTCQYSLIYRANYTFPSVEHFFQASKAVDAQGFDYVMKAYTPGQAKKRGRQVQLISNWDSVKDSVMYNGVFCKFSQNVELKTWLLNTAPQQLIEGNTWEDTYWGVCRGVGQNKLGLILMTVRSQLTYNNTLF